MALLEVPGGEIYFEAVGTGVPVVLAHGVGGNHAIWFKQVATLSKAYQVITFDHRGFGNSQDRSGAGRAAFADDLAALLDHLEIESAALVGQSMGAGTCLTTAMRHPGRVAALILCASLHAIAEPPEVRAIMDRARGLTADLPQLDRVLSDGFRRANPAEAVLYSQISSFNTVTRRTLAGEWPGLFTPAEIGASGIPTLFIASALDPLFPIEAIRLVREAAPGALLVEIDDAGHSGFFERPAEFNDSVLSFLAMCGLKPTRAAHSNNPGYSAAIAGVAAR